ncbi:MAG: methylglutaconyl-CoA hydratase [Ectothiorhodospiraceae bacterium]|nr:methylglutaconyl-CoA hydratase [Ectothiorhodospiraceae bacterium]
MSEVLYSVEHHIGTITLNRPEKRNALSANLVAELHASIDSASVDENVRVIVITGAGKAFCAGADLAYLQQINQNSPEANAEDSRRLMDMIYALRTAPKPTVAKVNGHALAGGCGLALACDIVIAQEEARLGFTEVRIGFVPAIIMKIVVERLGSAKARELLLRGNQIYAPEAERIGMINHSVAESELDGLVDEIAGEIAGDCSPQSTRLTKQLLDEISEMPLDRAMEHCAVFNALSRTTDDFKAGIASFLEKKPLKW